jgi:polyketide cyclase/dehydrase/lipid transport protein
MMGVTEEVKDQAEDVKDDVEEKAGQNHSGIGKKLLLPAAAGLGTVAATYAARKGPELLRERLKPKLEKEGGEEVAKIGKQAASRLKDENPILGGITGKIAEKAGGGGGGGREKTRRLPIQRWTDVAVPVETAYEKWTQFEEYPKYMHRVLNVEQEDDSHLSWEEKIWFSRREWEGEITDRRENDRIAWKTTKGPSHSGVVSFHRLEKNLTRVMVTVDFHPGGMIEKMASGLRFVKRAVQADLARFKAYVEFSDAKGLEYMQPGASQDEDQDDSSENGSSESQRNGEGEKDETQQRARKQVESAREKRAERRKQRQS